jgi:hypothetical protein
MLKGVAVLPDGSIAQVAIDYGFTIELCTPRSPEQKGSVENLVRGFAGVVDFLDVLQQGFPGVNAGSLVASLGAATLDQSGGTPGVTAAVSGSQATAVLVVFVVATFGIAGIVLRRQDVK